MPLIYYLLIPHYTHHRYKPNILSWGTPHSIGRSSLICSQNNVWTLCAIWKIAHKQFLRFTSNSKSFKLATKSGNGNRVEGFTHVKINSNTFIAIVQGPHNMINQIVNASSVDLSLRNPNCMSDKRLLVSRYFLRRIFMIFSNILDMAGKIDIGRQLSTQSRSPDWYMGWAKAFLCTLGNTSDDNHKLTRYVIGWTNMFLYVLICVCFNMPGEIPSIPVAQSARKELITCYTSSSSVSFKTI